MKENDANTQYLYNNINFKDTNNNYYDHDDIKRCMRNVIHYLKQMLAIKQNFEDE